MYHLLLYCKLKSVNKCQYENYGNYHQKLQSVQVWKVCNSSVQIELGDTKTQLGSPDWGKVMPYHFGALMQFRTASMSAMLAITKHGVCVGIIAVQNCISASYMKKWQFISVVLKPCWLFWLLATSQSQIQ